MTLHTLIGLMTVKVKLIDIALDKVIILILI
jgi:hypothetical protein